MERRPFRDAVEEVLDMKGVQLLGRIHLVARVDPDIACHVLDHLVLVIQYLIFVSAADQQAALTELRKVGVFAGDA